MYMAGPMTTKTDAKTPLSDHPSVAKTRTAKVRLHTATTVASPTVTRRSRPELISMRHHR